MRSIEQDRIQSRPNGTTRSANDEPSRPAPPMLHLVGLKMIVSEYAPYFAPSRRALTGLLIGLCIAMFAWTLSGCASSTPPSEARAPIPANLTAECPPLNQLADGTGATVLRWITEAVAQYQDCRDRHRRLVEAL